MDNSTQGRLNRQVSRVQKYRRQLLEDRDLCLTKLLPKAQVEAAITRHQAHFRQRLYTPLVTIWTFLYQVLTPDQSCRAAVARLLALLCLTGEGLASAATGAYCKARQSRCPSGSELLVADLARSSGRDLHDQIPTTGLLNGRPILLGDGTTVSMPDTPANQKTYPQQPGQKEGLGFPILRLVGLISLSCGAVLNVALAPYSGKRTGETSLLRQLLDDLHAGDILLADAIFSNYWMIALLLARGVDIVTRHRNKRKIDFRTGQRLSRYDHLVQWHRPQRPAWMRKRLYESLPETLTIREMKVEVRPKGFRCRHLLVTTTLLDDELYRKEEIAMAFRARWHAELDLGEDRGSHLFL